MNAQLQAQLAQVIAQIAASVGEGKDFALEQLPEIAQQYVAYGLWINALGVVFFAAGSVALLVLSVVCFCRWREVAEVAAFSEREEGLFWMWAILTSVCVVAFVVMLCKVNNLILVLTAPKVWFVLELGRLMGHGG